MFSFKKKKNKKAPFDLKGEPKLFGLSLQSCVRRCGLIIQNPLIELGKNQTVFELVNTCLALEVENCVECVKYL